MPAPIATLPACTQHIYRYAISEQSYNNRSPGCRLPEVEARMQRSNTAARPPHLRHAAVHQPHQRHGRSAPADHCLWR